MLFGTSVSQSEITGLGTELASSVTDDSLETMDIFHRKLPSLPTELSPAQAAELSEVLDFLHRALAEATDPVRIPQNSKKAQLPIENWHRIQLVLTFLSQYSRHVADPCEPSDLTDY